MIALRSAILALLALAPSLAAASPSPTPPRLRLGDAVHPLGYRATLTVDPDVERFDGTIEIEIEHAQALPLLWLNASGLDLQAVAVSRGDRSLARTGAGAIIVPGGDDFVGVAFEPPLSAGRATVRIDYRGELSSKDSSGASRQREGDEWYVFTNFEPLDARRVFPCFDEPSFKVPWQLTLRVPSGDRALANTAVARERRLSPTTREVSFQPTRPLPSYLVAFAVGPFDVVDGGRSARSRTPVRIITPKGMAGQARWAAQVSRVALDRLEDYTGIPYPYGKLDLIAVPLFGGAMENPGLITFSSQLILRRPEDETIGSRRSYASVAVHELAHQWFGDLVTTAWWDDIWLNEAFATWMTPKIIETWQPGWGAAQDRVGARSGALWADSLLSARRIRQPITSKGDVKNAFDGITYGKGAAVLAMFERWLTPAVFQRGARAYLAAHADRAATARDFLAAMSRAAGKDVGPAMSSFLDQPGAPLVAMTPRCAGGAPTLELSQSRYLPVGSPPPPGGPAPLWQVPVCVRYGAGDASAAGCTLLTSARGTLALDGLGGRCPAWIAPNQDGAGYYRAELPPALYDALLADGGTRLTLTERIAAVGDLAALVRAGRLPYAGALRLVPRLARDPSRQVVRATLGLVAGLRDDGLVSDAELPAYRAFIQKTYGERARAFGWTARKGDSDDDRLLRGALVPLVADQGADAALRAQALALATGWLRDRRSLEAEAVEPVLGAAALTADRALFDALRAAAPIERDRLVRRQMIGALARFRDPAQVAAAQALVLDDRLDIRESLSIVWGAAGAAETRALAYRFVAQRFDALVARLPRDGGAGLARVASGMCDAKSRADAAAFFTPRAARITGGPRQLAQTLEAIDQCVALRRSQAASVAAFFASFR